jgi:hypothetical protein
VTAKRPVAWSDSEAPGCVDGGMDDLTRQAAEGAPQWLPCVFEKALAMGCATCTASVRGAIAEREAIGCASPSARADCATLAALTRERSAFALRVSPGTALPHAIAVRLQCGGLDGLRGASSPEERDVRRLVAAARAAHGGLADLPWPNIVVAVMLWQGRRPGRRHPP